MANCIGVTGESGDLFWRNADPAAGCGDRAQLQARAQDGASALPSVAAQTAASGKAANRAFDLPGSAVDAKAQYGTNTGLASLRKVLYGRLPGTTESVLPSGRYEAVTP